MSRYRLNWYELEESDSGDWLVKFPLGDVYSELVDHAFPNLTHIGWRPSTKSVNYTYIKGATSQEIEELGKYLQLLKHILVLRLNKNLENYFKDELDQCFALDFNLEDSETYTDVGQLEYEAKYNRDQQCANKLAKRLAGVCASHPNLNEVDCIAAVPGNPGKEFHLPDLLVEKMGEYLSRDTGLDLRKSRSTPQLKNLPLEEKIETLKDVFVLDDDVKGESILLVDDLYQSGTTMWTLARFLKENGADKVYGLVCVKSWRDTDNI
nr:ComF family protein [Bacillota bacterium]